MVSAAAAQRHPRAGAKCGFSAARAVLCSASLPAARGEPAAVLRGSRCRWLSRVSQPGGGSEVDGASKRDVFRDAFFCLYVKNHFETV